MPRQKQPWTTEELQQRERLLAAARARGLSLEALASECGASRQRVQRWSVGTSHLRPAELDALERLVSAAPEPGQVDHLQAIAAALGDLAALAGQPEESDEKDALRGLIAKLGPAAVGGLVKLAVTAKSERVRLAALSELLDRGFGRPVQAYVDRTPSAPAGEGDLIAAVLRAMEGASPPASGASPVSGESVMSEPPTLSEPEV